MEAIAGRLCRAERPSRAPHGCCNLLDRQLAPQGADSGANGEKAIEMVNLDDPKEFFRVIVDPNLQEFYAKEGDLRLAGC
jgi:hypothetical protein